MNVGVAAYGFANPAGATLAGLGISALAGIIAVGLATQTLQELIADTTTILHRAPVPPGAA